MNKLLIILLFIPFFADAQIGLLLRPLPTETGGVIPLYPGNITDLVSWIVADSTASVTYSGGTTTVAKDLVTNTSFTLVSPAPGHDGEAIVLSSGTTYNVSAFGGTLPSFSGNFTIAGVSENVSGQSKGGPASTSFINGSFADIGVDYSEYDFFAGGDTLNFTTPRTGKEAFVIDVNGSTLADVDVYANNSLLTPSNSPTTSIPSMSSVLGYFFATFIINTSDFKIYELLVIDNSLSASDRASLFQYLYDKHSITP